MSSRNRHTARAARAISPSDSDGSSFHVGPRTGTTRTRQATGGGAAAAEVRREIVVGSEAGKRNRGKKNYVVDDSDSEEAEEMDDDDAVDDAEEDAEGDEDEEIEDMDAEGEDDEDNQTQLDAEGDVDMDATPQRSVPSSRSKKIGGSSSISKRATAAAAAAAAARTRGRSQMGGDNDEEDDEDLSDPESEAANMTFDQTLGEVDAEGEDDEEGAEDGEGEEDEEEEEDDEEDEEEEEEEGNPVLAHPAKQVSREKAAPGSDEDEDDGEGESDEMDRAGTPDLSKMTRRQRARFEDSPQQHMKLSDEVQVKKHFTAEELSMRRAEMARRRRNLSEKRTEEVKMETINKLLKKQAPKGKNKLAAGGEDGSESESRKPDAVFVRWVSNRDGIRVSVPEEILDGPAGAVFKPPSSTETLKKLIKEVA